MADTLTVNIVDRSVPPMSHVNIAVINQPNPVEGYAATGEQLLILIQMSNYFITETATGIPVTGKNIYEYFPDLDPGGGGGGGVTVDTQLSTTSTNPVQNKAIAIAVNSKQDILTFDNEPTQNSTNMVKSGGIYSFVTNALSGKQDTLTYDAEPTENSTNMVKSGGIYSYIDSIVGDINTVLEEVL